MSNDLILTEHLRQRGCYCGRVVVPKARGSLVNTDQDVPSILIAFRDCQMISQCSQKLAAL